MKIITRSYKKKEKSRWVQKALWMKMNKTPFPPDLSPNEVSSELFLVLTPGVYLHVSG